MTYPESIATEAELDQLLSQPSPELIEMMTRVPGNITILGCAGKIGVSLAMMAKRAADESGVPRRIIGVDLFLDEAVRQMLDDAGIETVRRDLLNPHCVADLERTPLVIYMAGKKFGTQGQEATTWAMNVVCPTNVSQHFRDSHIVVFSTGCVYALVPLHTGGCTEETAPDPIGDYAQSCLGRERVFAFACQQYASKVCLFRLNYAIDLRYGVLHDIGQRLLAGEPIDVSVPAFNCIWQADANDRALRCLEYCASPASVLNVSGPETISTHYAATELARLLEVEPTFSGEPGPTGYLSNSARSFELFGYPRVDLRHMLRWTADWLRAGGRSLGKPTHFEVNDGKY